MKKKTFIFLLISILMMSAAIAFAGCKRGNGLSDGESLPSAEEIDETVKELNELIASLPSYAEFGAAHVSSVDDILARYDLLDENKKSKVDLAGVQELLKKAVYLDAATTSYIQGSTEKFVLKPYLTGKKVLSVSIDDNKLYVGQYKIVNGTVEISSELMQTYVPSVCKLSVATDVGAIFDYTVYVGMKIDESFRLENVENTSLIKAESGKLEFTACNAGEDSKSLICLSKYDGTSKFVFKEGRIYNLFVDFVAGESDDSTFSAFFEGVGGLLYTVSLNNGTPYIEDCGAESGKYATLSYKGNGVYSIYSRFVAERGCDTLVLDLDGKTEKIELGNIYLYPLCGKPEFKTQSVTHDIGSDEPLILKAETNGGDIYSVTVANKPIAYSYNSGEIQIPDSAFDGFETDTSYDLKVVTQFGVAVIEVTLLNGVPVVTGKTSLSYPSPDGSDISFGFDLKDKEFANIRLNGKIVDPSAYVFNGETLTFSENYLKTVYGESKYEMTFKNCKYRLNFSVSTDYIYKSSFDVSASDSDLQFAPDGIGTTENDGSINWARYYNPGQGTTMILTANTFNFVENSTYRLTYKMKIGAKTSSNWWSPVFTNGHDLIYIKQSAKGVLVTDDVYAAGNPLDTVYSVNKENDYYIVEIVFTAKTKGVTPFTKLEFANWGGSAELYFADIAIEKYREKIDVLLLGSDLLSDGYWINYKKSISLYTVANEAKIGATISDVYGLLADVKLKYAPRKILLSIGENDLYAGATLNEVKADYEKLIDKIKNFFPDARLYALSVLKSVARKELVKQVEELNTFINELGEKKSYKYADITTVAEENGIIRNDLFLKDGLHITKNGYSVVSKKIKSACRLDGSLDALFIGDSYMSVAYWNGFEDDMRSVEAVNLGVGGTQTVYWKDKLDYLKNNYTAESIAIHIGVNDIDDGGASAEEATTRIKDLLNSLHAAFPESKIIWMTISPNKMFEHKNYIYPTVNSAIKDYATENEWLVVCDVARNFTDENGRYIEKYYLSDGMHLNSLGYKLFVKELKKTLGM